MDAVIKQLRAGTPADVQGGAIRPDLPRASRAEAEAAVKTLISYIVEYPDREAL